MRVLAGNRLSERLADLRARGERGVLPFVTAGDGGLETTLAVMRALERAGATAIELGMPFSDPIADGPVLQAAAQRALAAGTDFAGVCEVIRQFRAQSELPLVLLTYLNPVLRHGLDESCAALAGAGADGLLCVDVPVEEGAELSRAARANGLCGVFFASPTSDDERVRAAAAASDGFLYAIGRFGVTGGHTSLDEQAQAFLARVRRVADPLPVAVGFGIAAPAQVKAAVQSADLAIVGSALVDRIHAAGPGPDAAARAAEDFLRPLTEVLRP